MYDITFFELVQNNVAHLILHNYHCTTIVMSMKTNLSLPSLAERCKIARLSLFQKIYSHSPVLKQDVLHPPSQISSLHYSNHKVGIPFCRTNACFTTVILKTLSEWLPPYIAIINTIMEFNRAPFSHFSLNNH